MRKPNVRKLVLGVAYRPPNAKVKDAMSELSLSIEYIRNLSDAELIVSGDLNINYNLKHSKSFEIVKKLERKFNLNQIVKYPTRIVEGSKSLLDLIFTDAEFVCKSGIVDTEISDHLPVFLVKKKDKVNKDYSYITGRTYSVYDKVAYQNDLLQHGLWDVFWNTNSKNIELLWSYMLHIIMEIADIHCPVRRMKISNDNPHWMSKEIIECIRLKDEMYKKA